MRVVFLSTKLCKSTVVDAASGTLLFELATPGFRKRKTTMYDHQGNTIGIYHRHFWRSDKVCFRGQTRRLSEWMPKKRWSSYNQRRLNAPDGRFYTWKKKCWRSSFQLVDRHTKRVVAKARRKRLSVSGLLSKRRTVIDVAPDVVPMIDAIVFSFVVWGRLREEQASSGVTAAAAT